MNFFKSAASAVSAASKMAADSAKRTYAELKAYPTQVRCSACPTEIDVPHTAFDWTCASGHVNKRNDELCVECKVAQPADLPTPIVACPSCQAVTPVPTSNAKKNLREAAVKTKEFAVATAASTKASVDHLRAAPTTFHCAHCNTLLAVPTGPWACQTCTTENLEECKACKQCGQKKSAQKAICGVCRQSTDIPASNFVDSVKHTVKDISKSGRKAYYDAAGKPYVTCGKCSFHVPVPVAEVSRAAAASPQHAAPAGGAASPVEGAPAPGGLHAEGVYHHGESLVCPSCKNPVEN